MSKSILSYKKTNLYFAGQSVQKLAAVHGSPLYVYDLGLLKTRFRSLKSAFRRDVDIHFAMKANHNKQVLQQIKSSGGGVDTVSGGEIRLALKYGFRPDQVIFSGVGKSHEEIELAIRKNIKILNVESPSELDRVGQIAARLNRKVSVGFRYNPHVNAKTHPYISTGFRENKFGMGDEFLPQVRQTLRKYQDWLQLKGVSLHIGSQIKDLKAFKEAVQRTRPVYEAFQSEGHQMAYFDVGGGLAIDYFDGEPKPPTVESYARVVQQALRGLDTQILLEPGRWLIGPCGILIAKVEYIKTTEKKRFVILNSGMNHLLRPALYEAKHRILSAENGRHLPIRTDVVGPVCESSDFLGLDRRLPLLHEGDFVVIAEAGAYGMTMASSYNLHPLPKELTLNP